MPFYNNKIIIIIKEQENKTAENNMDIEIHFVLFKRITSFVFDEIIYTENFP